MRTVLILIKGVSLGFRRIALGRSTMKLSAKKFQCSGLHSDNAQQVDRQTFSSNVAAILLNAFNALSEMTQDRFSGQVL